ncbi:jmjC domain-containing protein 8 isoform X2 [Elephas maximus indicus]|uniref:jmjC domain-containing protein 8 isoform X2 n=1 Tax=Elephas maximus indicus TaxID=99487 RepID=UPI0021160199|nr:jmjC domain-containing protein 8 isoform X2 [Elephas maximus indicus]
MSRLPVARTRRGAAPSPRVPALVGGGLPGGGGGSGDGGRVAVVTGGANHDSVRPALCLPGRWADLSNSFREPRGAHLLPGRRISQPLWAARSAAGLPGVPRGGGRDAGGVDTVVAPGVRQLLLLEVPGPVLSRKAAGLVSGQRAVAERSQHLQQESGPALPRVCGAAAALLAPHLPGQWSCFPVFPSPGMNLGSQK